MVFDQFNQFVAEVWAMKPRRDEDGDPIIGNPSGSQHFDHGPEEQLVRNRPCDIADGDASGIGAGGYRRQFGQGIADRLVRVAQYRHFRFANDRNIGLGGNLDLESSAAVE